MRASPNKSKDAQAKTLATSTTLQDGEDVKDGDTMDSDIMDLSGKVVVEPEFWWIWWIGLVPLVFLLWRLARLK